MKKDYEENGSENDKLINDESETYAEATQARGTCEVSIESWTGFEVTRKSYLSHDFEISEGWGEDNQVMNTLPPPRPRPGGGGSDGK
ncbi:hypothetical protein PS619_03047 [Pseudomonas fluorescens]|nr:hypothetical protein PS619_03047 [Pseudomonas fluorescens]